MTESCLDLERFVRGEVDAARRTFLLPERAIGAATLNGSQL